MTLNEGQGHGLREDRTDVSSDYLTSRLDAGTVSEIIEHLLVS